jgi:hypothetical protein
VDEEDQAISVIRGLPFKEFRMHGVVAKRRIVHFGLGYVLRDDKDAKEVTLERPD